MCKGTVGSIMTKMNREIDSRLFRIKEFSMRVRNVQKPNSAKTQKVNPIAFVKKDVSVREKNLNFFIFFYFQASFKNHFEFLRL